MWQVFADEPPGTTTWDTLSGEKIDCIVDGVPTLKCFEAVFSNVIIMASSLVILVLLVMFVVGAISYLTSLGNPEKVKKAQNTFKYAIVGLVLFISAFLILKTIDYLFLGNQNKIFKFEISPQEAPPAGAPPAQQPNQPGGQGNNCAPGCDFNPNTGACINCPAPQ